MLDMDHGPKIFDHPHSFDLRGQILKMHEVGPTLLYRKFTIQ